MKIGYCMTGSFCTFARSIAVLRRLKDDGHDLIPIMSENAYSLDTRFGLSTEINDTVRGITSHEIISTIPDAEPLGPSCPLDLLIVAPCTGNTLAKVARGITDTAATMAIKAHLRLDRPTLIALSSNDSLSQNLESVATMLRRKAVYFVPMRQDDPERKPHSLVAELERIPEAIDALLRGEQLRPLFT